MKIKILQDTVCGGKRVKKGRSVEANEADAKLLIAMGKAEEAKARAKKDDGGGSDGDPDPED